MARTSKKSTSKKAASKKAATKKSTKRKATIATPKKITGGGLITFLPPPPPPPTFKVTGLVRSADGKVAVGAIVQAFDKDLRSEQSLGITSTR